MGWQAGGGGGGPRACGEREKEGRQARRRKGWRHGDTQNGRRDEREKSPRGAPSSLGLPHTPAPGPA